MSRKPARAPFTRFIQQSKSLHHLVSSDVSKNYTALSLKDTINHQQKIKNKTSHSKIEKESNPVPPNYRVLETPKP